MPKHSIPVFFLEHGRYYAPQSINRIDTMPFVDHPDLPGLIDVLSRKNTHHALLQSDLSAKMHIAFIEALLIELRNKTTPATLQNATLYYLNLEIEISTSEIKIEYTKALKLLRERLDHLEHHIIIAVSSDHLIEELAPLLSHPKCHVIIFTQHIENQLPLTHKQNFSPLILTAPTDTDIINLLKQYRVELENFHDVFIPEELLSYAYGMTERYLSTTNTFDNSLLLLDSSAARTSTEHVATTEHSLKPLLTIEKVNAVLSAWTKIEASYLNSSYFNIMTFTDGMQGTLFGQDVAISTIGKLLQQSQLSLKKHIGPLCHFLFVGQTHAGKKTAAVTLARQLFGEPHMLYFVRISANDNSLLHLKAKSYGSTQRFLLEDIIREKPYAIILFENIETASPALLSEVEEMLKTGELYNEKNKKCKFHQSLLIFTTTLGSDRFKELTANTSQQNETNPIDLMQLVMKEIPHSHPTHGQPTSDLADAASILLSVALPNTLSQSSHIIPFVKPQKSAIERILRQQFDTLGAVIKQYYGVELDYAPEVIHHLANTIFFEQQKASSSSYIRQAVKEAQWLIERTMHTQPRHSKQDKLRLQLNETGHALRCDWQTSMAMWQHTP